MEQGNATQIESETRQPDSIVAWLVMGCLLWAGGVEIPLNASNLSPKETSGKRP